MLYLSGPISGHIEEMKKVFAFVQEFYENKGYEVWNPMEVIPNTSTWDDSMVICRKTLTPETVEKVILINYKDYTPKSRGVAEELEIAKKLKIPVLKVSVNDNRNVILEEKNTSLKTKQERQDLINLSGQAVNGILSSMASVESKVLAALDSQAVANLAVRTADKMLELINEKYPA